MSKKIILGSSSITILKEVEWNLPDSEYEILPANDPEDFKEQMKTQKAALFIIDRDMQDGQGGALCKEIKSSEQFASVPVLLLVKQEFAETDDAILAIGKLEARAKNYEAAIEQFEKIRSDYPSSELYEEASLWIPYSYMKAEDTGRHPHPKEHQTDTNAQPGCFAHPRKKG